MGYVFISYSSTERETADAMRNLLNKYNIDTWMAPNDIPVGSKYAKVIGKAVKNCTCFVLMLSNASQNSIWVAKEVERAINYRKTIFPVQMEALTLNDEFEMYISTDQIIAIRKVDEQADEVQRLLGNICSLMQIQIPKLAASKKTEVPGELAVGSVIDGKYLLLRKLSSCEYYDLYLAVNEKTEKMWQMKIYSKQNAQYKNFATKLLDEIDLMKKLRCPGIPDVVDIVDTVEYLMVVMDHIEGEFLSEVLTDHGIQEETTVIDWAFQLCDILNYLHSRIPAIIHNDIRPSNIMLTPAGKLVLLSYGMARKADALSLENMHYMAPETFGAGGADVRTDIYSLGATVYTMVTGSDPSVPPHVIYPIRQVNPKLSAGLERIISKCMERDPKDRYQNIEEVYRELENLGKKSFMQALRRFLRR